MTSGVAIEAREEMLENQDFTIFLVMASADHHARSRRGRARFQFT
jgi:hypothetical protein